VHLVIPPDADNYGQGAVSVRQYTQSGSSSITTLNTGTVIQASNSFSVNGGTLEGTGEVNGPVVIGADGTLRTQTLTVGTLDHSGTWEVSIESSKSLTTLTVKVWIRSICTVHLSCSSLVNKTRLNRVRQLFKRDPLSRSLYPTALQKGNNS